MSDFPQTIDGMLARKQLHRGGPALDARQDVNFSPETLKGRLVEFCSVPAAGGLTLTLTLARDFQHLGEWVSWVTSEASCFYPPDAKALGIDLQAFTLVRVPPPFLLLAADKLARSGSFGLIGVDLSSDVDTESHSPRILFQRHGPAFTRLHGLARKHHTAIVFLTQPHTKTTALSSQVSLRTEVARRRLDMDCFELTCRGIKDRRHTPGWRQTETCHGPAGLY